MPKSKHTDVANHKSEGGVKVKCKFCNYEWTTRSEKIYVVCPSCLRKNKIAEMP